MISITKDDKVNKRIKHIDVHYHKVCKELKRCVFELFYIPSNKNLTDICIKILRKPAHEKLSAATRFAH
jgi:hypothetical protein